MSTAPPPLPLEVWETIPPQAQAAVSALVADLNAQITDLSAQVLDLKQQVRDLTEQVRNLTARLHCDSTNSSKPPSSDPPSAKPRPPKSASRRRRGGQPGHPRHSRVLVPPEQLHAAFDCFPQHCRKCNHPLEGTDPEPIRHQVAEIPPIAPEVTEYRCHRLGCPACGTTTSAPLPEGVPLGAFGPRLAALLALLAGTYRLSKRQIQALAKDVFGLAISTGMVCKLEQQTAEALAPADAEVQQAVERSFVLGVDETGWRQEREKAWLWVAVGQVATLFRIAPSRSAQALHELVGGVPWMVLICDRFPAYGRVKRRQVCWAHLRRDFQQMIDRDAGGEGIGGPLKECCDQIFHWWDDLQCGRCGTPSFRAEMDRLREAVRELLERGRRCACAWTAGLCARLLEVEEHLWRFASMLGLAPHNNGAERALRHGVIWRKVSFGTDSERGSRFVERMLTVVETCRQRGRDVLGFLVGCLEARLRREAPPSLLA